MTIDPFAPGRYYDIAVSALNSRAVRQDMISSNIANADTPFYKSRDLSFEEALQKEANRIFNNDKGQVLELAKTDTKHLSPQDWDSAAKPDIFFRDGHLVRNDGNTVDLDIESSEMSKNNIMYNAVMNGIKKEGTIFASVIQASQSTQ